MTGIAELPPVRAVPIEPIPVFTVVAIVPKTPLEPPKPLIKVPAFSIPVLIIPPSPVPLVSVKNLLAPSPTFVQRLENALTIGLFAFASSIASVLSRNVPSASFAAVSSPLVFAVLMKLPILPKRPFLPNKPVSPPPSVLAPCVRIAVNTLFNVSSVVTSFSILVIISLIFVTTCVDFMLPRIEFFQFSL